MSVSQKLGALTEIQVLVKCPPPPSPVTTALTTNLSRRHAAYLVLFFVLEAQTRRSSLEPLSVVRPGLVGLKLHHLYYYPTSRRVPGNVKTDKQTNKHKKAVLGRRCGFNQTR